jgi:hypothetical protein
VAGRAVWKQRVSPCLRLPLPVAVPSDLPRRAKRLSRPGRLRRFSFSKARRRTNRWLRPSTSLMCASTSDPLRASPSGSGLITDRVSTRSTMCMCRSRCRSNRWTTGLPFQKDFGYFGFLAIGGVSFLVIGHRHPNRVAITCRDPIKDAVSQIWPISTPLVVWPPELMMDRQLIDVLFQRNEPPVLRVQVFGPR